MINIFAPVNDLGVGTHSFNMMMALDKRKHEICLIPPFGRSNKNHTNISKWLSNRVKFDVKNPSIMIFDTGFLTQFSGTPRIGFAVFETNALAPEQLAAIRSCDYILTPSKWGQSVLRRYDIDSYVVNEGVDPEIYGKQTIGISGDCPMTFVHVGKFEERKGTMQVLDCFFKALKNENAYFEMHCENPFNQNWSDEIINWFDIHLFKKIEALPSRYAVFMQMGLKIKLCKSQSENLASVYSGADCGIFPSKGEGWGLPLMECIASGTPVIAGAWSGQSEYLTEQSGYLLRDAKLVEANDGVWYHGDRGEWYEPTDEELISQIKEAFRSARNYKRSFTFSEERKRILSFTWERAAEQLENVFDKLNLSF